MAVVLGGICPGGSCPGGSCPGGHCPGWPLSWVAIVLGCSCPVAIVLEPIGTTVFFLAGKVLGNHRQRR